MLSGVFTRRYRGFRVVDLAALAVLLVLALVSYALKTLALSTGSDTAGVERQIAEEDRRVRLLQAEIAHLEAPDRLETLATQYLNMHAVDPKQDISVADLPRIAREGDKPVAAAGAKAP
jgi:cell division protein FtsL